MKCELTGIPENEIDRPDDELAPDTSQEKVDRYLSGYLVEGINIYDFNDKELAACFRTLINVYRDYEFDKNFTSNQNNLELLAQIKVYLNDSMLELIDET